MRVTQGGALSDQVTIGIKGITENISKGGIGLLSEALLPTNAIVRCEFTFPGNSMSIPTLLQVRWCDQVKTNDSFRIGLKFVF
jgi:hypothetical protein